MSKLKGSQNVNKVAKYLHQHLDGAYKLVFSANCADVYMVVYYQKPGRADTFSEMHLDINIATYQEKIRINVIEMNELEQTLGQIIMKPEEFMDLHEAKVKIWKRICKYLSKEYAEYDFIY